MLETNYTELLGQGKWIKERATEQQLVDHVQEYLLLLKVVALSERHRQLNSEETKRELETALDARWEIYPHGKPDYSLP